MIVTGKGKVLAGRVVLHIKQLTNKDPGNAGHSKSFPVNRLSGKFILLSETKGDGRRNGRK
jgi:hypothetical protein